MGRKFMGSNFGGRKSLLRWIGDELEKQNGKTATGNKSKGPKPIKLTAAQRKQIQIQEYKRLSSTLDDQYARYFSNLLLSGYGIKTDIIEIYDGYQGSEYDYMHIEQTGTEVRIDKVLLCYSIAKQAYMTIGLDYKLNAASILFYSRDIIDVIGNLNVGDIITESLGGETTDRIVLLYDALKNFDNFHNLQNPYYIIKTKEELFPELIIDNIPIDEGEKISDILD